MGQLPVDDMLGEKIAVADTNFCISDPETLASAASAWQGRISATCGRRHLLTTSMRWNSCIVTSLSPDGGGIRADENRLLDPFKTCKQGVGPRWQCVTIVCHRQADPGCTGVAALCRTEERRLPCGATRSHADIPDTVQTDEKNVWIGSATKHSARAEREDLQQGFRYL